MLSLQIPEKVKQESTPRGLETLCNLISFGNWCYSSPCSIRDPVIFFLYVFLSLSCPYSVTLFMSVSQSLSSPYSVNLFLSVFQSLSCSYIVTLLMCLFQFFVLSFIPIVFQFLVLSLFLLCSCPFSHTFPRPCFCHCPVFKLF